PGPGAVTHLSSQNCWTRRSMSSLLCIAGPPGAGKSTVSALVSARLSPSVLIRGDAFYRFLDQGAVAPWLPEATDQNRVVIRASGAAAGQFVRGGYDVIYDGVLGPWWLPTFFEATELVDLHYAIDGENYGGARDLRRLAGQRVPAASTLCGDPRLGRGVDGSRESRRWPSPIDGWRLLRCPSADRRTTWSANVRRSAAVPRRGW